MNHHESIRATRRGQPATVRDVARACGVSTRLVMAILNEEQTGSTRASAATRARVRAAAARLGYRPNRTARNIQRGRHGSVGLLVGDVTFIRPQELQLMIDAARQRDWLLVVEQATAGTAPKLVREDCVDGLLFFQTMDRALCRDIVRARLPLVQINTNTRAGAGCITYDEEAGMRRVVRLLAARGRTQPALLIGDRAPAHYSDRVRPALLRGAAPAAGMAAPTIARANDAPQAYTATAALLRRQPRTDCIILHADSLAPGVWRAATEAGRRIPRDLSVISFYRTAFADTLTPRLTTLHINPARLAQQAFALLDVMVHGRRASARGVTLPYELVPGGSV
jgi:LacI family transcriptional regulator